ncbi:hypothetical protein EWE75_00620 [Sphingomonas populi]|uniref:Uncharacterized protein n=1 Tax=Sphingomonas populi TaxID=2484750 RepID=A0A4Q6Y7P4_9SPHN|nr:hypothetical protein [Sphingomonas populi]RZF66402.1 hypothetical protein EWE75_00620 [Sphingomonas populi]
MKPLQKLAFAAAACALTGQAAAQPLQARACLTAPEAESLLITVIPDALEEVSRTCTNQLPAGALLRSPGRVFGDSYRTLADANWPNTRRALAKILPPDAAPMLDNDLARLMVISLAGPIVAQQVKPTDCGPANRFLTMIAPLPPRNAVAAIVAALQIAAIDRKNGTKPAAIPVCPFGAQ